MFSKYHYVYAVYETGSITKAAEKLFISQPSLSVAIQKLEKELGAPIFERTGSGVTLTEIGKEYIRAAKEIHRIEQNFSDRLRDIYQLETGSLAVGGTNYLCSYILPHIITRFNALYPKIEVTLTEANSKTLGSMIEREEVDIVVDSFDANMDLYQGEPLSNERILLCVPASRPINRKLKEYALSPQDVYSEKRSPDEAPPLPIALFREEPFILLKNNNDMYHRAEKIFQSAKLQPPILFQVDQLNISYALAESGMGACFATDTLFKYANFSDRVVLYNIDQEHNSRTLYLAYKKNKYCTAAMRKFIEVAKEVIKK